MLPVSVSPISTFEPDDLYNLKLSWQLNSIKYPQVCSLTRWSKGG